LASTAFLCGERGDSFISLTGHGPTFQLIIDIDVYKYVDRYRSRYGCIASLPDHPMLVVSKQFYFIEV
jgi:hypothetical protein